MPFSDFRCFQHNQSKISIDLKSQKLASELLLSVDRVLCLWHSLSLSAEGSIYTVNVTIVWLDVVGGKKSAQVLHLCVCVSADDS